MDEDPDLRCLTHATPTAAAFHLNQQTAVGVTGWGGRGCAMMATRSAVFRLASGLGARAFSHNRNVLAKGPAKMVTKISDLNPAQVTSVLALAHKMKSNPTDYYTALQVRFSQLERPPCRPLPFQWQHADAARAGRPAERDAAHALREALAAHPVSRPPHSAARSELSRPCAPQQRPRQLKSAPSFAACRWRSA